MKNNLRPGKVICDISFVKAAATNILLTADPQSVFGYLWRLQIYQPIVANTSLVVTLVSSEHVTINHESYMISVGHFTTTYSMLDNCYKRLENVGSYLFSEDSALITPTNLFTDFLLSSSWLELKNA